ncbi:hypothetical protein [Paenibacillus polymyxa]|uniref:hypothetical protein n=1 Tax=Paenibacillus polymyxa TaxID=1406 RepID=UPI001ABAA8E0|nr:hypothetical protein [Paenibacillus polymyxa]
MLYNIGNYCRTDGVDMLRSKRQGTSPYDGSRAEHEEDGDPPRSPGETGVTPPASPETRAL